MLVKYMEGVIIIVIIVIIISKVKFSGLAPKKREALNFKLYSFLSEGSSDSLP